jgi:transposase-like protein
MDGLFKGRHFDQGIIVLCVRWYLRYKLWRDNLGGNGASIRMRRSSRVWA